MADLQVEAISLSAFCKGLLFGLRAAGCDSFVASGTEFHQAFLAVVEEAKKSDFAVKRLDRVKLDPVFSVVRAADQMLLEGEERRILSLMNPTLERALFKIDGKYAEDRLEALPECDWYKALGAKFSDLLPK